MVPQHYTEELLKTFLWQKKKTSPRPFSSHFHFLSVSLSLSYPIFLSIHLYQPVCLSIYVSPSYLRPIFIEKRWQMNAMKTGHYNLQLNSCSYFLYLNKTSISVKAWDYKSTVLPNTTILKCHKIMSYIVNYLWNILICKSNISISFCPSLLHFST